MTHQIPDTLRLYLNGEIDLDTLEYRVIALTWGDKSIDQGLVDRIAVELVYIMDGVSDEELFRTRAAEILAAIPFLSTLFALQEA